MSAIKFVAMQSKTSVPADASVTAKVGIGPNGNGGFGLAVDLHVALPGVEQGTAEALVAKAHEVCPYSNATRNNIAVNIVFA